jgi:hypothetical protein
VESSLCFKGERNREYQVRAFHPLVLFRLFFLIMRICFFATGRWIIRTDGRTAVDSLLPKEVKFNGFTKQFTLVIRAIMPQLSRASCDHQ